MTLLLIATGCASSPKEDKIGRLREIAIVIDTAVLQDRTSKPSLLDVTQSDAIGSRLENVATERLRAKGYLPRPRARTVGLSLDGPANIEVALDSKAAAAGPILRPFVPAGRADSLSDARLSELHRAAAGDRLPPDGSPFGPVPVLVIGAKGRYISEGAVAANVGKIVVGIVVIAASVAARGGGNGPELDEDTLDLTLKLFDPREPVPFQASPQARCEGPASGFFGRKKRADAEELSGCGPLLWRAAKHVAKDPDEENFAKQLDALLRKLPPAIDGRSIP